MIASDVDQTARAIAEGRYHEALGVAESAGRLEIETAAAQLEDERQDIAQAVTGIVQLLTVPEKLEIYRIACQFRDAVIDDLRRQYGEGFFDQRRQIATRVWSSVQQLLRCDGEKGSVKIGPRAAGSLAREGRIWIIEEVVNTAFVVIEFTPDERNRGTAVRFSRFVECPSCGATGSCPCSVCDGSGWLPESDDDPFVDFAPDFPEETSSYVRDACEQCAGVGSTPCDCQDDFVYAIPSSARPGDVIQGTGLRTGRSDYVLFQTATYSARPSRLLEVMHTRYNLGKNLASLSEAYDITLDEARRLLRSGTVGSAVLMAAIGGGIGLAVGASRGTAAWGVIIGLACLFPAGAAIAWHNRGGAKPTGKQAARLIAAAFILIPLLVGLVLGYLSSSWQAGMVIGGSIACLWALIVLLVPKASTLLW